MFSRCTRPRWTGRGTCSRTGGSGAIGVARAITVRPSDRGGGGPVVRQNYGATPSNREPANLGDILERVLDRGVVIAGDIRVNLLDIELLTIKLRLLIASVDTARELGIDWWE